ncbi:MAG: NrsF family protein [Myxococcota bacterium]
MVPEPELQSFLGSTEPDELPDMDALYDELRTTISDAEKRSGYRWKSQPTSRRRLLGVTAFALVLIVSLLTGRREDFGDYPPTLFMSYVAGITALLSVAVFIALRPIHRPALRWWQSFGLVAICVVATGVLAIAPGIHDHVIRRPEETASLIRHAAPCLLYGSLFGLPVYGALRFLDRGRSFVARALAACAAGLAGNMVLEVHCPLGGATHLLAGHAAVIMLYVFGILAFELALRRRRR